MTRTLLILLFGFCATAQAQFAPMRPLVHEGPAWTNYLAAFDFEETGTPTGTWSTGGAGGTISYDHTADPLEGAESLTVENAGADAYASLNLGSGYAELYVAVKVQVSGTPSAQDKILIMATSGASQRGYAMLTTGNKIDGGVSGGSDTTASTVGIPTTGYVSMMIRYKKGTGTDAEVEVWVTDNTTSWGTPTSSSNGTGTDDVQIVRFWSDSNLGSGFVSKFDKVFISQEYVPITAMQ